MKIEHLQNKKIVVVGLGVNNHKLAAHLKRHKIKFDLVDEWRSPSELVEKLDGYEIIFRTPGLPFFSEAIQRVIRRGGKVTSQTSLFFELSPCPIIGVTGTKGKGTTATLLARILEKAGRKVWLAGNIGLDPFDFVEKLHSDHIVVLELSSFQLQDMTRSPHIAVVLKITPEHLDHHKSFEEYVQAKKTILRYQKKEDFAVVNYDSEVTRGFAKLSLGKVLWNSVESSVKPGCFVRDDKIYLAREGSEEEVMPVSQIKLLGRFNLENITAAIAAAQAAGVNDIAVIRGAVAEFEGLPHRLEFVRESGGVKFYDDSFATTPETTIAAISAFEEPVVLVAGGSEKKSDYADLGKIIARSKISALLPIGVTGPLIAKAARKSGFAGKIVDRPFRDMKEIVAVANEVARRGDTVLLSPASASFDMFKNYKERGDLFKESVRGLK